MVTGGAGYIGAHVVELLHARGDSVLVVDDLSTGDAERLPAAVDVLELDLADRGERDRLVRHTSAARVDAVVHLAARKVVGESVERPLWYQEQNVGGLVNLLGAVHEAQVPSVLFSSSAAVYGATSEARVDEDAPTSPVNPYGRTKLEGEWLVRDAARAWGLRQMSLRYFNVAGAGRPGLADPAVLNLVTIVLDRWSRGLPAVVHGTDYATPDGSCVRDYVHVQDLADAHLAALDHLTSPAVTDPQVDVLNIGTGRGVSVLEMIQALARAAGEGAGDVVLGPRRPGDPPQVVADPSRAEALLGWCARADLSDIAGSAWAGRS